MKRKVASGLFICGLGLLGPWGCADNRAKPMDASLFIPPSIQQTARACDQVGPAVSVNLPQSESPKNAEILPSTQAHALESIQPLDPLQASPTTAPVESVDTAVPAPASATLVPASTGNIAASGGQGVYMTLGGVLAQVNNTGIYANQVLSPLRKEFTAKAREMEPEAFRQFAEQEIARQLQELIEDELYFATSYNALSAEDRKLAEAVTVQVRQERVTAAGGSVQRARQLALEEGEDFDQSIKAEYRRIVHQLYERRHIEPLIQVTADDMRDFYSTNLGKLYSEKDRAQFRVIMIDPALCGGMPAAREKINSIREKAVHGGDFTALAATENQSEFLKGRGGNPCDDGGWMERNTYRFEAVEAAIWKLQPGQVTPVVETEGALYIARLDAKHLGVVRAFEDQTVQLDIYNRLHQQQLGELWRKSKDESVEDRMINTDDSRIQIAVDMAMQTYQGAR